MSMVGGYVRLEEAELKRVLGGDPAQLPDFLFSDRFDDSELRLDIDKTWHIIHFLLNGDPWQGDGALGALVLGGTEIGDGEEMGYGPARYLLPDEVAEVAAALAPIPAATLLSRFDAAAVARAKIYPEDSWSGGEEDQDYIAENFEALKRFFAAAAQAKHAMILWLS
jgi:hypothetical protein